MRRAGTAPFAAWFRQNYFVAASAALLFLTVWGFSDNLFWNVSQPSNSDPKFVVHGAFCLTWMVILFAQAVLVGRHRMRTHRRLGRVGAFVALGVASSTLWVFVAVWEGWQAMPLYVQANRLLLPSYAVFVAWAIVQRRRSAWHKRLMLLASFFMLEPVLSRAFDPIEPLLGRWTDAQIDAAWALFYRTTWTSLFLSLFAYDRLTQQKIHPATWVGAAWFGIVWLLVAVV